MDNKVRIYLASPLFTISEQFWNEIVASELRAAGYEVFNPQSDNSANDKDNPNVEVSAKTIFDGDTREVLKCNIIVANFDGLSVDSGVAGECGMLWGLKRLTYSNTVNRFFGIVGYRSDIRKYGEGDQRFYFNQYMVGMVNDIGTMVDLNTPVDKLDIESYRVEARKIVDAVNELAKNNYIRGNINV